MSSFFELIENNSGKYKNKINNICRPLFETFGINYFFHQSVTRDGQFYVIGTNPNLMLDYVDLNFHKCNPFITDSKILNREHTYMIL